MAAKPIYQFVFFALSAYNAYCCWTGIVNLMQGGYFPSTLVRFRVLSIRDQGLHYANISEFGLLYNGCKVAKTSSRANNTFLLNQTNVNETSIANGYYFSIPKEGLHSLDPLSWQVESSVDNGYSWQTIGASVWRTDSTGRPEFFPQLQYDPRSHGVSTAHSHFVEISSDMRLPLSWTLNTICEYAIFAMGFAAFTAVAVTGHGNLVQSIWVCIFVTDALLFIASCAVIVQSEPWLWREAVELPIDIFALCFLAIGFSLKESKCMLILVVYCGIDVVSNTAFNATLYDIEWMDSLLYSLDSTAGVGLDRKSVV